MRRKQFNEVYMNITKEIASLSYAKKKQVGCIIVDENDNIISFGYNGTPRCSDNTAEYIDENGELKTKPEVIHAESNAITKIAKSNNSSINSSLYITLSPCIECAKLIIQAEIKNVYYNEYYNNPEGIELLKKNNVNVYQL